MAQDSQDFDPWLCERLQELKTDESIFGPYITSILEGDEDDEEKIEALDGLLAELGSNLDVESLRNEILKRWKQSVSSSSSASSKSSGAQQLSNGLGDGDGNSSKTLENKSEVGKDSEESLLVNKMESFFKLSEEQNKAASSSSSATNSKFKGDIGADSALRAAILSQYSANDSSEGEEEADGDSKSKGLGGVAKNVNAEKVAAEQRELKEKSRADHAKKKERDKEDRNKQKQAQQDRKEKAKKKSQKVERKR